MTAQWSIYECDPQSTGVDRAYYEIKIVAGTPFVAIPEASWLTADPSDTRIRIQSEAQSPFRWLQAEWRVYVNQTRTHRVIDEIGGSAG